MKTSKSIELIPINKVIINDVEFTRTTNGWQVCPKCSGQGVVWFPTGIPMNDTFCGSGDPFKCDLCNGKKIISISTGLPPE